MDLKKKVANYQKDHSLVCKKKLRMLYAILKRSDPSKDNRRSHRFQRKYSKKMKMKKKKKDKRNQNLKKQMLQTSKEKKSH